MGQHRLHEERQCMYELSAKGQKWWRGAHTHHKHTHTHAHTHTHTELLHVLSPSVPPSLPHSLSSSISLSHSLSFSQTFKYHHHAQLDEMVNSALEKGEYKAATGLEVMVRGDLCTVENIVSYTPPGPHTCSIKLKPWKPSRWDKPKLHELLISKP